MNLNQSNVTLDKPKFIPMLGNLQANILKFHGRTFAYHLFFQLNTAKREDAKSWIKQFANEKITTAKKQLEDTKAFKNGCNENGGTVYTLSLSRWGYESLGIEDLMPDDTGFKLGLQARAELLDDTPASWIPELQNEIDMLILVADDDPAIALSQATSVISSIDNIFGKLIYKQRGNVLKMKETGIGIEHFGYADGISQPMYLEDEIQSQPQPRLWNDATHLDLLLVKEKNNGEDCFGSYLVFRKLEQNVKCFKIAEGDESEDPSHEECKRKVPEIKNKQGIVNDELSGASIVGRFENGTPVTIKSNALDPNPHVLSNDFDYTDDKFGLKCPYHAHIRLMNPRRGDPITHENDIKPHRITRRGMPFDDNDPKRIPDNSILKITDEMLEDNQPEGGVGLLFFCYQSSIEDQFEILQAFWANKGLIGTGPSRGQDSLITQGSDDPRSIPFQWGQSLQTAPFQFSGFIKMRGGEYFFTPSICMLKNL